MIPDYVASTSWDNCDEDTATNSTPVHHYSYIVTQTVGSDSNYLYIPKDRFITCHSCGDFLHGLDVCFMCCHFWNPTHIKLNPPKIKHLFSLSLIREVRRSGNKHHDRFPKEKFA